VAVYHHESRINGSKLLQLFESNHVYLFDQRYRDRYDRMDQPYWNPAAQWAVVQDLQRLRETDLRREGTCVRTCKTEH